MAPPAIFMEQVFARKLFAYAGTTLLFYDYLLTLPLEADYIWHDHWSIVKSLFLINRYVNLIGQAFIMLEETGYLSHGSQKFCVVFQLLCPLFLVFSGVSIRLFVVMRTCAIMGCKRSVALFVNVLCVLYSLGVVAWWISMLVLHLTVMDFEYLEEVGLCITPMDSKTWWWWLLPTFIDYLAFVVVWYHLYQVTRGFKLTRPSRFIRLLLRDALLFFLAALFNDLFGIVCWTVYSMSPGNFFQKLITFPLLTIIGQRAVLNLRQERRDPVATEDFNMELSKQIAAMHNQET